MPEFVAELPSAEDLVRIMGTKADYLHRRGLVIALLDTMHRGERNTVEVELGARAAESIDGIGHWSDLKAIVDTTPYEPFSRRGAAGADFGVIETTVR